MATRGTPEEPNVLMNFHPEGQGLAISGNIGRPPGELWPGIIDEVGFYNRALTPDEVLKNATSPQLFAVEPLGKLSFT